MSIVLRKEEGVESRVWERKVFGFWKWTARERWEADPPRFGKHEDFASSDDAVDVSHRH